MPDSKIILVTGASSGIGGAVAARLAAGGHHVVAGARREDRLADLADLAGRVRDAGGSIDVRRLDVTDRANVAAFVDPAVAGHGRVDVIVNNAGVMPMSRLDALLVDEWDQMRRQRARAAEWHRGDAAALPAAGCWTLHHDGVHRGARTRAYGRGVVRDGVLRPGRSPRACA
ncbi:SDR family oxidoreductase [Streptomyces chartreusis]